MNGQSRFPSLSIYLHPRILVIFFLGFSSGLPLALTASTLGVWLMESGVNMAAIGMFAAAATPYNLKFLWSPLIDGMPFPILSHLLGRRRGWLVATQLALIGSLTLLALSQPQVNAWWTALAALLVAICSASQDIVIDAYRVEILSAEQQGAGAATVVLGYRLGMIASGAGALTLATFMSWPMTYMVMAALMVISIFVVLFSPEPEASRKKEVTAEEKHSVGGWLSDHVVAPFADFMTRPQWLTLLLFILLYKLADAFMGLMPSLFYLQLGFSKAQIAGIRGVYGVIATIVGGFIGGAMVSRMGMVRSLWICGIAHAATNLMFVAQAKIGADAGFLIFSITLENVTGGMGTSAFVAFLSNLTRARFTATQYALLSSFAAIGRTWLSTPAGWFVNQLGWSMFFLLAASLAIPGLVTLWYLNRKLNYNENINSAI